MSETVHPSEIQRIGDMAPSSQGGDEICHQKCKRILCIPGSEDTMQSPRSMDDLLPRLRDDPRFRRFWTSPRSIDSNNRERQLAVDFISASAGGA
jgi:hypothetical protein